LAAVVVVVIGGLMFLKIIPIVLQVFSIMLWLFAIAKYFFQSKKQVFKKKAGRLHLSEDQISINHSFLKLSEIISIKLFITGWKSYKRSPSRNQPIEGLQNGDKNFITITGKDGVTKCEFFLSSEKHWQLLREHLLSWYRKRMIVSEEATFGKSYGLQNLNYKEIQEFKKEIHTNKISAA
jgi:hypothetical protein